ncbi:hypothetical protein MLD38_027737 [Melastoma candidum]|uniref:Uncharacterized protein n=1 Tax=Melastoma candidum TaxID=119954 RepID=A0ACB9P357_9MYRT|nr:hypothetical protein MLD38_027737 [Melastoma candidum]
MSCPGIRVSPGTVSVHHGTASKASHRRVRVVELIIRCLMCGLAFVVAVLVGTDSHVREIFGNRKAATFTDMKALIFLVIANGTAASYSLVQASRSVASMIRGNVLFSKPLAWVIFSGDQVMAYVMVAALAASLQSAVLAKAGQPELQWKKICDLYERFCTQVGEGIAVDEVYHVSVMPCYDKKLEAVSDNFSFQLDSPRDADEAMTLTEMKEVDFKGLEESQLDTLMKNVDQNGNLYGVCGSSGGYAETIFRYAAKELYNLDLKGPLDFKIIINADLQEVTLDVDGKRVLKFALCHGFRNLQNVGCLNGGGQIKPGAGKTVKDLIQALETIYMEKVYVADPFKNPRVRKLYEEWLEQPGSKKANKHMHTEYRRIVKSLTSELHNW